MNYGMYVASSGALSQIARQEVIANNLANIDTVGFKAQQIALRQRDAARIEDDLGLVPSDALIERLGAGVMPTTTFVDVRDAPVRETHQPLDLALRGDGFFVVRDGAGRAGLKLTRDGRFTTSSDGVLVRANGGMPVVGEGGGLIRLDPTLDIVVRRDGTIVQDGAAVGRVRLATVPEPSMLEKVGNGMLRAGGASGSIRDADGADVVQGFVEQSGVNPIGALMSATAAAKAAEGNLGMVGMFNDTMGQAISRLGRVS